jgi:hypothetical protein
MPLNRLEQIRHIEEGLDQLIQRLCAGSVRDLRECELTIRAVEVYLGLLEMKKAMQAKRRKEFNGLDALND